MLVLRADMSYNIKVWTAGLRLSLAGSFFSKPGADTVGTGSTIKECVFNGKLFRDEPRRTRSRKGKTGRAVQKLSGNGPEAEYGPRQARPSPDGSGHGPAEDERLHHRCWHGCPQLWRAGRPAGGPRAVCGCLWRKAGGSVRGRQLQPAADV